MNRIACGFIVMIAVCLFISSCQKEVDGSILTTPQTDSTRLSKLVALDTTMTPGADTTAISNFRYDSQKRLISKDFTEISGPTRYTYYYDFSYNNNDTLPFKVSERHNFNNYTSVTFFYYSNGFIIRDSTAEFLSSMLDKIYTGYYTALGGTLYLDKQYVFDPSISLLYLQDSIIYKRTMTGNNLTAGVDSVWDGTGFFRGANSFQAVYDNKISPQRKFNLLYNGNYWNYNGELNIDIGINNVVSGSFNNEIFPASMGSTS